MRRGLVELEIIWCVLASMSLNVSAHLHGVCMWHRLMVWWLLSHFSSTSFGFHPSFCFLPLPHPSFTLYMFLFLVSVIVLQCCSYLFFFVNGRGRVIMRVGGGFLAFAHSLAISYVQFCTQCVFMCALRFSPSFIFVSIFVQKRMLEILRILIRLCDECMHPHNQNNWVDIQTHTATYFALIWY